MDDDRRTDENGRDEDIYGDVSDDVWCTREQLKEQEQSKIGRDHELR